MAEVVVVGRHQLKPGACHAAGNSPKTTNATVADLPFSPLTVGQRQRRPLLSAPTMDRAQPPPPANIAEAAWDCTGVESSPGMH